MHSVKAKHTKKIPLILLIAVIFAVFLIIYYFGQRNNTAEYPDYASAAPSADTAYGKACGALLDEYRAMLTVSEMEWETTAGAYAAEYPRVNRTYVGFYHLGLVNTLYAAFYDIDGNGTDEFFIGLGDRRDVMEVGVYAFDGETLVPLSLSDTPDGYQIFTDGTFMQSNKGGTVTAIKKIAPGGCSLENTESTILAVSDTPEDEDIIALGGHLVLNNWAKVSLQNAG